MTFDIGTGEAELAGSRQQALQCGGRSNDKRRGGVGGPQSGAVVPFDADGKVVSEEALDDASQAHCRGHAANISKAARELGQLARTSALWRGPDLRPREPPPLGGGDRDENGCERRRAGHRQPRTGAEVAGVGQPTTIGPPTGVLPRNTSTNSAMTRPAERGIGMELDGGVRGGDEGDHRRADRHEQDTEHKGIGCRRGQQRRGTEDQCSTEEQAARRSSAARGSRARRRWSRRP